MQLSIPLQPATQGPVLVLTPPRFSDAQRALHRRFFQKAGIHASRVHWRSFHTHQNIAAKRKKNDRFTPPTPAEQARIVSGVLATGPSFLVINDRAALYTLTGKASLHLCRGSSYRISIGDSFSVDAVVLDDVSNTQYGPRYGKWIWENDCAKIKRFITGTTRPQPIFEYEVVRDELALSTFELAAAQALLLSVDIETWGKGDDSHITCVGVGCYLPDGRLRSYVIPFHTIAALPILDPARTRPVLAAVLRSTTPKVMQNGIYDSSHLLRERLPVNNWWIDTAVISHSIWQESPKRLDFLATLALDHVQYWKDETRTAETAASDIEEPYAFPRHAPDVLQYWKYCALDVYYTAAITPYFLGHLGLLPWARDNYVSTLRQVSGPALLMAMSGVAIDEAVRQKIILDATVEASTELTKLGAMVNQPDFNPRSPTQVASLLYDVLDATPLPRKGRKTSEDVLKMLQPQSFLLDRIIEQIWMAKKPAGTVSKYGPSLGLQRKRMYYSMSPTGTTSFRYSSSSSPYGGTGTNAQNLPKDGPVRSFIVPDPGYVLVEIDYAQSDAYFTAFSSGEPNFIRDLLSPEDAHCLNASRFFKKPYDTIYEGYRADAPWVNHSTKGVRQITKRIVYGANYRMGAYTLYIQMGYRSVVAAAESLGYYGAANWTFQRLVNFCEALLGTYFEEIYPGLNPWLDRQVRRAINESNLATCIGGITRSFFGDLNDHKIQREFAAFFGQTGTAANLNKSLERVFYERDAHGHTWLDRGGRLIFQVHDSLLVQIPVGSLALAGELAVLMDNERTAPDGRVFRVPTETKIGFGWGKRMMDFIPGKTTIEEVRAHDQRWQQRFFGEAA